MKLDQNPCKPNCPRRSATCHSECPDYKDYRQSLDDENAKKRHKTHTECYIVERNKRIRGWINGKKHD
jgi:hypothetical protein